MITARFEFIKGEGGQFCPGVRQDIIEMRFEGVSGLIETIKEFRPYIRNCTAQVDGKIVDLRTVSGLDAPA